MSYFIEVLATTLILAALAITCAALSSTQPRRRHRGHRPNRNRPA